MSSRDVGPPEYRILLALSDARARERVGALLQAVTRWRPAVTEVVDPADVRGALERDAFDVLLVDQPVAAGLSGAGSGSALPSMIVLTEEAETEGDMPAADSLPLPELTALLLDRAIEYAVATRDHDRHEGRFRALIENSRDLVTILDRDARISYISPAVISTLGYEPAEREGVEVLGELHPDDRDAIASAFNRIVVDPEATVRLQYRVRHADGSWRWLDTLAQNCLGDPLIRGVVVNSWDITELRETQKRIRFQAQLLDNVGQPVLAVDRDARVSYWNRAAESLTGWTADEMIGNVILDRVLTPASRDAALQAREAAIAGRIWEGDLMVARKDGGDAIVHVVVTPAIQPDGTPGGRIATGQDVTELRLAGEHVRFQASLLDAVGQAVIATDMAGQVTYWNRAAENLYGWKREEALGRSIMELTPAPSRRDSAEAIMNALRCGDSWSGEFQVQRKDGSSFIALVTNAPLLDDRRELAGIVGISTDVTERHYLEEQLRQAQKMEAIGRLAGGVAHDFNNLLTAIRGHTDMLLEDLPGNSPLREDVRQIQKSGERAGALTRQLLAFSRKQVMQVRNVDLGAAVLDVEPMLHRLIPERIQLKVERPASPLVVEVDSGQLAQLIMNLVVNAVDAIEDTGSIVITMEPVELSAEEAEELPWHAEAGGYARLCIQDTGTGIPEAVLPHIFEPFYTTKEEGRGTGLGLSTVYGIIKQSGGHIFVDTEPGRGTRFDVFLRLATSAPDHPGNEPRRASTPHRGSGTILLVEDDDAVRGLARRVLQRAGYHVLQARHGREALDAVGGHSGEIALVLSDVVMPEMGGVELAERLRQEHGSLPLILMSGYSEAALRGELERTGARLLTKPFTPDALLSSVGEVLARR